ncbi:MAG: transglycosylase SLT domain-containing protein [Bacteriovoracaceae bacterium]|nr:transglycosylase SLT domain-containing protein [Bacteriovoracaceae bacterium]
MSLFQYFAQANLLIVFAASLLAIIDVITTRPNKHFRFLTISKLYRVVALCVCLMPFIVSLVPQSPIFAKTVQVWSGQGPDDFSKNALGKPYVKLQIPILKNELKTDFDNLQVLKLFLISLSIFGFGFMLLKFFRDRKLIKKIIGSSYLIKKHNRVEIYLNDNLKIPFSTYYGRTALLFIPSSLLSSPSNYKMSMLHELAHHRHGDTIWLYFFELLRGIFFINPFVHLLIANAYKYQELACDESIVGHRWYSTSDYCHTLLNVAQLSIGVQNKLVGTACMSTSSSFLKRRINMTLLNETNLSLKKTLPLFFIVFSLIGSISYAAQNVRFDKRISMEMGQNLASRTQASSGIPIVMNQDVLKWLNLAVGTPRGRHYVRASLKRKIKYEKMIKDQIEKFNFPMELMAVPMLESGYQNFDNMTAAGIWSFTPGTARAFGLRVDDEVDERFDPKKLTGAAMRYYLKLQKEFEDWHLSLLAYNSGESRLRRAIIKLGSSDAFELITKSKVLKKENKNYLPKAMAFMIIYHHPELIK